MTYSINDARNNYAPRHSIPINGNIYTGTSTLKAAVNKYVDFRNSERVANPIYNRNNQVLHRNNHNLHNNDNTQLQNRDFSVAVAEIINRFPENFTANDLRHLTDLDFCQRNFNCNYPILVEIPHHLQDLTPFTHVWGHRRFYNDIFINHSGRRYLISNDWYHRTERANRNMFKRWIVDKASILSNIIRIF